MSPDFSVARNASKAGTGVEAPQAYHAISKAYCSGTVTGADDNAIHTFVAVINYIKYLDNPDHTQLG